MSNSLCIVFNIGFLGAIMMRWALLFVLEKSENRTEECLNCLDKLIELDPLRTGRYNDLKNKLTKD